MTKKRGNYKRNCSAANLALIETTTHYRVLLNRYVAFPDHPLDRTELDVFNNLKSQEPLVTCESFEKREDMPPILRLIMLSLYRYRLYDIKEGIEMTKDNCRILLEVLNEPSSELLPTALIKHLVEFTCDEEEFPFCESVCEFLTRAVKRKIAQKLEWALGLLCDFTKSKSLNYYDKFYKILQTKGLEEALPKIYATQQSKQVFILSRTLALPLGIQTLRDDLPELYVVQATSLLNDILEKAVLRTTSFEDAACAVADVFLRYRASEAYTTIESAALLLFHFFLLEHVCLILRVMFHLNKCPSSFWEKESFFGPLLPLLDTPLLKYICQFTNSDKMLSEDTRHSMISQVGERESDAFFSYAKKLMTPYLSSPSDSTYEMFRYVLFLPTSHAKKLLVITLLFIDQNLNIFSTEDLIRDLNRILVLSMRTDEMFFALSAYFQISTTCCKFNFQWRSIINDPANHHSSPKIKELMRITRQV